MFGLFLVVAVAAVGGLIAFVGDRVGMRVGRKRLTIFGLRPKYTSMAIAILTGILTAAATLGILSAASENARIAIFHLVQLRRDLKQATARNLELKKEYTQVRQDLVDVSGKWRKAQTELAGINETLAALHDRISLLTSARKRAEESLAIAQANLSATTQDLTRIKTQYTQVSTELTAARDEVKFIQQRKDNLENAIAILENQIESLSSQRQYFVSGVVDFATQPLIMHIGEVLAAEVVQPGKSFAEIEGLVVEMLNRADRIARDRGAVIENKEVGTRVDIKRLTGAYQILFNLDRPAVVRVVSGTNAIAGKPAFVYVEVLRDTVLFKAGDVVAAMMVDGHASEDVTLARIMGELMPEARRIARDKGMVTADGDFPIPRLSFTNLQEVLKSVAQASGRVSVKLTAARDLRLAGDSLLLKAVVDAR